MEPLPPSDHQELTLLFVTPTVTACHLASPSRLFGLEAVVIQYKDSKDMG